MVALGSWKRGQGNGPSHPFALTLKDTSKQLAGFAILAVRPPTMSGEAEGLITNGGDFEIIDYFQVHAELVEALSSFFSCLRVKQLWKLEGVLRVRLESAHRLSVTIGL
jgi:hypothetical protein